MNIIDAHTHVFPNADTGIRYQQAMGVREPPRNGTPEEIVGIMNRLGVSKSIMLLWLPTRDMFERRVPNMPSDPRERAAAMAELKQELSGRVVRYNEWGVETGKAYPELLPFVGADPIFMTKEAMVNDLEENLPKGAKGVKIVPMALYIYLNDPRLWPVYDFCNRTGLPLLTQSGGGRNDTDWDAWGRVAYLRYALEEFKNLKVICAHFGRSNFEDVVELAGQYPGLHADISSQVGEWGKPGNWSLEEGAAAIRKAGVDKILYGTNYPGSDPDQYVEKLKALPLSDRELEMVAGGNAERILEHE